MDRRWYSSTLDVQSFRGPDCDTYHYLVVAKVWGGLAVSKQAAKKFDVERYTLRKLKVKKHYQIKNSNRFAALENLNDQEDMNKVWENIKRECKNHS
jgi:hypothetical protein